MKQTSALMIFTVMCSLAGCAEQSSLGIRRAKSQETGEVVVVIMAGWLEGYDSMERIEGAVRREISRRLPRHRITIRRKGVGLLPEGDYDLFLALEYAAWKQRKDTPAGQQSGFVAIGHSSGATAIYNLLQNGTFKNGRHMPAFLGLVDMILPIGPHDLSGKIPQNGGRRTSITHYYIPTTARVSGIKNVMIPGANHFSIVNSGIVMQGLAMEAALACTQGPIRPATGRDRGRMGRMGAESFTGAAFGAPHAEQPAYRGGRYE